MRKRTDAMVDRMLQWSGCECGSAAWRSVDSRGNFKAHDWVRVECARCRAVVSLGPSADDSPEVRVEIRAAELAALPRTWTLALDDSHLYPPNIDGAELAGIIVWNYDSAKQPEQDGEWAGFLAAAIASHKEEK